LPVAQHLGRAFLKLDPDFAVTSLVLQSTYKKMDIHFARSTGTDWILVTSLFMNGYLPGVVRNRR
jgi:hypothetical protein